MMARVLVGCETSGVVREAFLARGHDEFRAVPGFPSYRVHSSGTVISQQSGKNRAMRPRPHPAGYRIVTLCAGSERRMTTTIHRLVATLFIPNPNGLPCVRHLDADKTNNAVKNLAWGTYADNEADKIPLGKRCYGTAKMKLNRASRDHIRRLSASGVSNKDLSAQFGVNRSTISRLLAGSTWTNRKWPMAAGVEFK